jgi:hypothetical protein
MAKQCPECKSLLHGNTGRCDACGCSIDQTREAYRTWESRFFPYIILVAIAVAIVAYLRGWFNF